MAFGVDLSRSPEQRSCVFGHSNAPDLLLVSVPPLRTQATNRTCTPRKRSPSMEKRIATVHQPYDGGPVSPRRRLLRSCLGSVGPSSHLRSFLGPWLPCRYQTFFSVLCALLQHTLQDCQDKYTPDQGVARAGIHERVEGINGTGDYSTLEERAPALAACATIPVVSLYLEQEVRRR